MIPADRLAAGASPLRPVKVMVVSPSRQIERIAATHVRDLPWTMRFLLRTVGAMNRNGSNLASYLLFEKSFCRALIDLGYEDTMARRGEMLDFLTAAA